MTPIVDIHCHNFNADDLPVRGFLHRVAFDDRSLAADIAALVDVLIQGRAPGYVEESRRLDALLVPAGPNSHESLAAVGSAAALEAEVDAAFEELQVSEPALLHRVGVGFTEHEALGPAGYEGVRDWPDAARRAIKWVKLFGMSRLDVTKQLIRNFDDRPELYTPLLVDLGMGLYDTESTPLRQQMELQEKISRLSMMGQLPGTARARIHPFIAFDPRRELKAQRSDVASALSLVQTAVREYGFVGVKLYPPMGWRPINNGPTRDMTAADAGAIDAILETFYAWCEAEQVPITAHCNASNEAHDDYREFSDPDLWKLVLRKYPNLHLNLGHFGGAAAVQTPQGWPSRIAELATDAHPFLFADVGNHRIDQEDLAAGYLRSLFTMFQQPATAGMRERLMYGSDWYMLAALPRHDEFLTTYEQLYEETFAERYGEGATSWFLGGAALRFLGFDDPNNANTKRLQARYRRYASENMPAWLALPV